MVFPGRPQSGRVRRHQDRLGRQRHQPGNGFIDLIFPTQYKTKNASAEGGYNSGNLTASLSYLYSKFENDLQTFTWNNGFFNNNVDTTYLAPDNQYQTDRGQRHVPRPAVEFDVRGTLHVAGNEE